MVLPKEKHQFYTKIILNFISALPDFKSKLQSEFPWLYSDIESASSNPNCSCVKKIEAELLNNKTKSFIILNSFLYDKDNDEKVKEIINIDYESTLPNSYQGKMFIIENNPVAFEEFSETLSTNRAFFRAFSTAIDSNGKLCIYFI